MELDFKCTVLVSFQTGVCYLTKHILLDFSIAFLIQFSQHSDYANSWFLEGFGECRNEGHLPLLDLAVFDWTKTYAGNLSESYVRTVMKHCVPYADVTLPLDIYALWQNFRWIFLSYVSLRYSSHGGYRENCSFYIQIIRTFELSHISI